MLKWPLGLIFDVEVKYSGIYSVHECTENSSFM